MLNEKVLEAHRMRYVDGMTVPSIADYFDEDRSNMSKILNGRSFPIEFKQFHKREPDKTQVQKNKFISDKKRLEMMALLHIGEWNGKKFVRLTTKKINRRFGLSDTYRINNANKQYQRIQYQVFDYFREFKKRECMENEHVKTGNE